MNVSRPMEAIDNITGVGKIARFTHHSIFVQFTSHVIHYQRGT